MMRVKKKRIIICLFVFAVSVICGGFLLVQGLVQKSKKDQIVIHESMKIQNYDISNFYVQMHMSKRWHEGDGETGFTGAQCDGIFYNNSKIDVSNWAIEIIVPDGSDIDSSWNGNYELKDNLIRITPAEYNKTIGKKGFATFGFILHTKQAFDVENVTVYGYKIYTKKDFILYWFLIFFAVITLILMTSYIIYEVRVKKYIKKQKEDRAIISQSLKTFANFIDAKDPYTKGHSIRVSLYSKEIARRMGMDEEQQDHLAYIALLHDVGKVGIPNEILNKPTALTQEERCVIKMHTSIGYDILKDFTALPGIQEGARYHHEWFDGSGYPTHVCGKEIPLFARIICVADSYDAMSSDRCYRSRLQDDEIVKELKQYSGTQFDPEIVAYMIEMIQDHFVTLAKSEEIERIS